MALYSKILGVIGTSFAIGVSGVAASGAVRVANNVTALAARNAAGSGDLALVGTDGSNNLLLGDTNTASILFGPASIGWGSGVAAPTITQTALASTSAGSGAAGQALTVTPQAGQPATGVAHNGGAGGNLVLASAVGGTSGSATAGAAGVLQLKVGATTVGQFASLATDFVAPGLSPAQSGYFRADNNVTALSARNAAGTADINLISTDNINEMIVGDATHVAHMYLKSIGNLVLQPGVEIQLTNKIAASTGGIQIGSITTAFAGGGVVLGITNAVTDPSSNPSGGAVWWSSLTVGASKQRTSSGWTKTTCGNTSTTVNTQLAIADEVPAFARITTSGNTMVVNVPLATSTSHADLDIRVKIKIAVAGTGTTVGDCFTVRQLGEWRNVAGTVSLVGSLPAALLSVSSASLNTSTVVITTSGTNIVITVTVNASSGTLGTADCAVLVTPVYN